MQLKKKAALLAVLCLALGLLAGCGGNGTQTQTGGQDDSASAGAEQGGENLLSGKHHVESEVQDYGTVSAELVADAAPITVTNFVKLAREGFYDGLTFHRVVPGFVLQGGDPEGNGTGGSGESIKGEFSANGVENNLSHTRGALSMARAQPYDSASSQFFIVLDDSAAASLDGSYAAFGYVTEGMEVVDKLCEETPVSDMRSGLVAAEAQPVITQVTVVD